MNIFDSIKPIYYISRIFGQYPYTISKNGHLETKLIDILILAANAFIYGILLWFNLSANLYELKNFDDISFIGMQMSLTIGLIFSFVLCLANFLFTKNARLILTSLHEIDLDLKTIQIEVDHERITKRCWYFILIVFVSLGAITNGISIYILCFITNTESKLLLTFFIINVTFSLMVLNFIFYVHAIWVRFHYLNEGLNNQFLLHKNKFMKINKFAVIHDKLNDVVEIINFHYSIGIMVGCGCTFFFTVINIFAAISVTFDYDYNSFFLTIVYMLLTFYYLFYVLCIIFFASKTTREVRD